MSLEACCHLRGGYVLPRAPDDVLLAVEEDEHTVGHLAHHVAGVKPAAVPRLFGRLGVLQVAGEEAVARSLRAAPAPEELALRTPWHFFFAIVDHFRLESTDRPPEGARADLPGLDAIGVDAPRLRHAPDLDEREAEALLEGGVQLGLHARAQAELDAMATLLGGGGLVQEQGRHHPQVVDDSC